MAEDSEDMPSDDRMHSSYVKKLDTSAERSGISSSGTALGSDEFELEFLDSQTGQHSKGNESSSEEEWLLLKKSNPFKRFFKRVWHGPREPADEPPQFASRWKFTRAIDSFPKDIFRKRLPSSKLRVTLLIVYCCVWSGIMYSILYYYLVKPPYFHSEQGNKVAIKSLECNSHLNWKGKNNMCGLNALECRPFDGEEVIIRCPALCDRGGWTYSAITVGDRRVKYTGYDIGGGERHESDLLSYPYRADSFPCGSAVHAGVVSPFFGGCAKLSYTGGQTSFPSRSGRYGTDNSVSFNSFFPASFTFKELRDGIATGCYDPRSLVVSINILASLPIFFLYESIVGYWIVTLVGYWTLVLALDPPLLTDPHKPETTFELISIGFQRLLPLCFILYVLWKCAVRRTLTDGSPLAKIICWFPTFWLGVMNNVTFDRLPVDRLTLKDLKEQAGAFTAVGSIILTILVCAVIQAYSLWKSGRFQKYFKIYISIIVGLVALGSLPGLTLRIHHYILGMMLVPGCATRGTSAYLFQGILIGLVLSGVGRWDFASIVETQIALSRGEAGDSWQPPVFSFNAEFPYEVSWEIADTESTSSPKLDGFSLLINDVERYLGENTTVNIDTLIAQNEEFSNLIKASLEVNETLPLYLRVARANIASLGKERGDYTNAAVMEWPYGEWHEPLLGVS
ncbi:LAFE_0B04654g1_1 [Lachancea fermentati]|uniref:LAFE_0B04654g1_1 n=1 Tax=Lachancea fermentati TaxID=4955 RepID=A0A1G4M7V1_LACFM|nr:LAFE_0B04654g1_1 [Lachancea fermentati]